MPSYSNIVSAPLAAANVAGATKLYATPDLLPTSEIPIGDIAYVISSKRLMIWNSGWYTIAIVNSHPSISTNLDPFTSFETDGTPIVLTLEATDPEGIPLVWSYTITSGSLGTTATVTQVDNEFTITPSTDPANEGEFQITFSVTDGVATSTVASTFRLSFYRNWRYGVSSVFSVVPTDLTASAYFGQATDTDGTHIIASAPNANGGASNSGRTFILDTSGTILRELINPFPISFNSTGTSVAISGDYAAVSSWYYNSNSGRVYIYDVDTGNLIHTLDNPNPYNTTSNDSFGYSVSIDGDVLAISAYREDDAASGTSDGGIVYIYSVSTGQLIHTILNPNAYGSTGLDYFGLTVLVRGNYVIVRASEDSATISNMGRVYVFNATTAELIYSLIPPTGQQAAEMQFGLGMDADASSDRLVISNFSTKTLHVYELSTGTLIRTLNKPSNVATSNTFGRALSVDGYTIAVADTSSSTAAAVWIMSTEVDIPANPVMRDGFFDLYTQVGSTAFYSGYLVQYLSMKGGVLIISQVGYSNGAIKIHNGVGILKSSYILNPTVYSTGNGDFFGTSVAMSGTYLLVGAPGEDDASGTSSGKVYVYDITTKTLLHTLDNPNYYGTSVGDQFGQKVSVSGDYAIISTDYEDPGGVSDSGTVYIYNIATGTLLHSIPNPEPNAQSTARFGISVSISGNYAAVGSQLNDEDGPNSGMAYIYNVTTGELVHTVHNPNAYSTPDNDIFGIAVCINGNLLAVGASSEDDAGGTDSGKVYIFDVLSGELLRTISNPNAYGTSASDNFGRNIAISGKYIIITAQYEDDAGGTISGKAYVFNVNTGSLLYTLDNPNLSGTSANDYYGSDVSVDGNYVVICAYLEDGFGGANNGAMYIYDLPTGEIHAKILNPTGINAQEQMVAAISGKYIVSGHKYGRQNLVDGDIQGGYVRVWEASA